MEGIWYTTLRYWLANKLAATNAITQTNNLIIICGAKTIFTIDLNIGRASFSARGDKKPELLNSSDEEMINMIQKRKNKETKKRNLALAYSGFGFNNSNNTSDKRLLDVDLKVEDFWLNNFIYLLNNFG